MKILITGANGMIGSALVTGLEKKHDVIGITRSDGDIKTINITGDFDIIIHCAAIKDIVWCEKNVFAAYETNVVGTQNIMTIDHKLFIYLSSDMANDINKNGYSTTVYGMTKLMAEKLVKILPRYLIIRCGLVYPDTIKWIDQTIKEQKELKLYGDRWREHIPLNEFINIVVKRLEEPVNKVEFVNGYFLIKGKLQSQLEWGMEYLKRKCQLGKVTVRPMTRKSTTHGSLGSEKVIVK